MQAGYSEAGIELTSFFICTTCLTMAMTLVYTWSPERSSSAVGCKQPQLSVHHFLIFHLSDHIQYVVSEVRFWFTLVTTVGIGGFCGGPVRVEMVHSACLFTHMTQSTTCGTFIHPLDM